MSVALVRDAPGGAVVVRLKPSASAIAAGRAGMVDAAEGKAMRFPSPPSYWRGYAQGKALAACRIVEWMGPTPRRQRRRAF